MKQYVVGHAEHDKALKKSWSSTASGLSSRCLDTVLPLDPARSGRESEVVSAPLPHYYPVHSACHLKHILLVSIYSLMYVFSVYPLVQVSVLNNLDEKFVLPLLNFVPFRSAKYNYPH